MITKIDQQNEAVGLARREFDLMKEARKEYGDIVPEVYGISKNNILMEHAGQIFDDVAKDLPLDQFRKIQVELEDFLGQSWKKGKISYLDPHSKNIALKKNGDNYQFKLIDWGSSVRKSEIEGINLNVDYFDTTINRRLGQLETVYKEKNEIFRASMANNNAKASHDIFEAAKNGGNKHAGFTASNSSPQQVHLLGATDKTMPF
jgi:tRNA A-37 threonylcarbamoyl transferase component Bud32